VSSVSFFEFLEESLLVLRREMPAAHRAFVAVLEGRRVSIETEGERWVVSFDGDGVTSHGEPAPVELAVAFDKGAVLDLVEGRVSLPRAVLGGRLGLHGTADAVDCFDRAVRRYVEGAVRCPSMASLLSRYGELKKGR
jgi:hypothetical protein